MVSQNLVLQNQTQTKPNLISNTLHAQLYIPHAQALHNPQANAVMQNRYS